MDIQIAVLYLNSSEDVWLFFKTLPIFWDISYNMSNESVSKKSENIVLTFFQAKEQAMSIQCSCVELN